MTRHFEAAQMEPECSSNVPRMLIGTRSCVDGAMSPSRSRR